MGLFSKPTPTSPDSKVLRRVKALPTEDLIAWAETCLYETGRSFSEYRKSGEDTFLQEAASAASILMEITAEAQRRAAADAYAPHGSLRR